MHKYHVNYIKSENKSKKLEKKSGSLPKCKYYWHFAYMYFLFICFCMLFNKVEVTTFGNVEFFWFHITETEVLFQWHKINKIILFRILVDT